MKFLSALRLLALSGAFISTQGQTGRKCFFLLTYGSGYIVNAFVVAPKKFLALPLGQVRPTGWLLDQVCPLFIYFKQNLS